MSVSRVLIVEDDRHVRSFLETAVEAQGQELTALSGGRDIVSGKVPVGDYSVLLLDLGLPDMDGVDLIHWIRARSEIPVIVISARTQEEQKIQALDAGADDYLTKPFAVGELHARIRAALRRSGSGRMAPKRYVFGDVVVDIEMHQVTRGGELLHLSPTEFRLLVELVGAGGRVVTQKNLMHRVWGEHNESNTHYLRIYMRQLRLKLEEDTAQPRYLLTEPGIGYRLVGMEGND